MSYKTGDLVMIKCSPLEGEVTGAAVDDEANYLVKVLFTDKEGILQERFFKESEIEPA